MHETMMAQSLLETISDEAAKQAAKPVSATISCGMFNAVNDEALGFAFQAIAKETVCEGMKLQIEHKPVRAQCKNCNHSFDFEFSSSGCPQCRSNDFELLPDAPLMLEDIEFSH